MTTLLNFCQNPTNFVTLTENPYVARYYNELANSISAQHTDIQSLGIDTGVGQDCVHLIRTAELMLPLFADTIQDLAIVVALQINVFYFG